MLTALVLAPLLAAAPASSFAPKNRPYDVLNYRIELRFKDAETAPRLAYDGGPIAPWRRYKPWTPTISWKR